MLLTNKPSEIITNKSQLLEIFQAGCKNSQSIGVESEKLLVYKNSNKAVVYEDVVKILNMFDQNKWQKIYDGESLIGLKSQDGIISLEPGSQIEISLAPLNNLSEITQKLSEFYTKLSEYAQKIDAIVLDSGIQPVSTFDNIKVIPKRRYEYMTKYLPSKGLTPFVMMRETAGIQVNFDYDNEENAVRKLALALKLSPIISALYSNSPIRNNKLTGYKSFRANSWLNVDEDRCGFVNKKLFENYCDFSFSDYAETLLDVPMIFISRGSSYFECNLTFREFMQKGFMGLNPIISDWETHISLYFPDVRLKSYVEIRNHDAQNEKMTFTVPAFWKGIMYNPDAIEEIENILSKYTYEDFMQLRTDAPIQATKAKLKNMPINSLIREFFDISSFSLKQNGLEEEKYLEYAYEYINSGRVPADNLIDNFIN